MYIPDRDVVRDEVGDEVGDEVEDELVGGENTSRSTETAGKRTVSFRSLRSPIHLAVEE